MLVSSFNLSPSFSYTTYHFYKKRLKSEINSSVYGPCTLRVSWRAYEKDFLGVVGSCEEIICGVHREWGGGGGNFKLPR
jgi:hypothetical protein